MKYRIYLCKRHFPINRPCRKKMRFSTSPIEYRFREIKKIRTKHGSFDHRHIKLRKNVIFKLYNFFRFKVCFQYFKLSRDYTCWQARSRLQVSIIAHCHWTRELIFFLSVTAVPLPILKNASPRGVYVTNSKMVGCAVTLDTSFAQFRNREYRTVNKVTLLNSTYIIPSCTNVNKQLTVK